MKLKNIYDYKMTEKQDFVINEELEFEEIQKLIDYAVANNLDFTIYVNDFTTEELGRIVKMVGKNIDVCC